MKELDYMKLNVKLHVVHTKHLQRRLWSDLEIGGEYRWRRDGEAHMLNPTTIAKLQQAVQAKQMGKL